MPKISDLTADTAPDGADLVAVVDTSASTTDKVTLTNLAASSAWSTEYAPLPTRIWVPASEFIAAAGSPVVSVINKTPVILFDASGNEIATALFDVPLGWTTYNATLWWVNAGAGTGDVMWRCDVLPLGDGDTLADPPTGSAQTVTALAQNVIETSSLFSGATAPTSSQVVAVELVRLGAVGGDTLANDAGVLGLMLVKAS